MPLPVYVGQAVSGCFLKGVIAKRPLSLPGEGQPIIETDRGLPFEWGPGLKSMPLEQGLICRSASPTRGPYPASPVSSPLAQWAKPAPGTASHGLCRASLHQ